MDMDSPGMVVVVSLEEGGGKKSLMVGKKARGVL